MSTEPARAGSRAGGWTMFPVVGKIMSGLVVPTAMELDVFREEIGSLERLLRRAHGQGRTSPRSRRRLRRSRMPVRCTIHSSFRVDHLLEIGVRQDPPFGRNAPTPVILARVIHVPLLDRPRCTSASRAALMCSFSPRVRPTPARRATAFLDGLHRRGTVTDDGRRPSMPSSGRAAHLGVVDPLTESLEGPASRASRRASTALSRSNSSLDHGADHPRPGLSEILSATFAG